MPPTWPYDVLLEARLLMFGERSRSSSRHTNADDLKATIDLNGHKVIVEGNVDAIFNLMSSLFLK